jgi:hypothetical protein
LWKDRWAEGKRKVAAKKKSRGDSERERGNGAANNIK